MAFYHLGERFRTPVFRVDIDNDNSRDGAGHDRKVCRGPLCPPPNKLVTGGDLMLERLP